MYTHRVRIWIVLPQCERAEKGWSLFSPLLQSADAMMHWALNTRDLLIIWKELPLLRCNLAGDRHKRASHPLVAAASKRVSLRNPFISFCAASSTEQLSLTLIIYAPKLYSCSLARRYGLIDLDSRIQRMGIIWCKHVFDPLINYYQLGGIVWCVWHAVLFVRTATHAIWYSAAHYAFYIIARESKIIWGPDYGTFGTRPSTEHLMAENIKSCLFGESLIFWLVINVYPNYMDVHRMYKI